MHVINHIIIKDGVARIRDKEHLKAELVARLYVDGEQSIVAVMEHYGLSEAEVHSALAYYYDNRAALDAQYAVGWAEIRENALNLETFKAKLAAKKPHSG